MFIAITTHITDALARLITQYKQALNLQNLITAIVTPIQTIENALAAMNTLMYLPNATGAQLDQIGVIVGLARTAGQSDADYLIALYEQITINIAEGQPETLIQIFVFLTAITPAYMFEFFPGDVVFESMYQPPNQDNANSIIGVLQAAAPAGVSVGGIVTLPTTAPFRYAGLLPSAGYGAVGYAGGGGYGGIMVSD